MATHDIAIRLVKSLAKTYLYQRVGASDTWNAALTLEHSICQDIRSEWYQCDLSERRLSLVGILDIIEPRIRDFFEDRIESEWIAAGLREFRSTFNPEELL